MLGTQETGSQTVSALQGTGLPLSDSVQALIRGNERQRWDNLIDIIQVRHAGNIVATLRRAEVNELQQKIYEAQGIPWVAARKIEQRLQLPPKSLEQKTENTPAEQHDSQVDLPPAVPMASVRPVYGVPAAAPAPNETPVHSASTVPVVVATSGQVVAPEGESLTCATPEGVAAEAEASAGALFASMATEAGQRRRGELTRLNGEAQVKAVLAACPRAGTELLGKAEREKLAAELGCSLTHLDRLIRVARHPEIAVLFHPRSMPFGVEIFMRLPEHHQDNLKKLNGMGAVFTSADVKRLDEGEALTIGGRLYKGIDVAGNLLLGERVGSPPDPGGPDDPSVTSGAGVTDVPAAAGMRTTREWLQLLTGHLPLETRAEALEWVRLVAPSLAEEVDALSMTTLMEILRGRGMSHTELLRLAARA